MSDFVFIEGRPIS